jgi:hypothetical protein
MNANCASHKARCQRVNRVKYAYWIKIFYSPQFLSLSHGDDYDDDALELKKSLPHAALKKRRFRFQFRNSPNALKNLIFNNKLIRDHSIFSNELLESIEIEIKISKFNKKN